MVQCTKCNREMDGKNPQEHLASMSGSIMGDECIESYYLCPDCGVYTVEVYWDMFSGDETVSLRGPVAREEGDAKVALIRQCAEPWDKKCRCPAHLAFWDESLD